MHRDRINDVCGNTEEQCQKPYDRFQQTLSWKDQDRSGGRFYGFLFVMQGIFARFNCVADMACHCKMTCLEYLHILFPRR